MSADLPYRPCVGICLLNKAGLVFAGRRLDNIAREAWQMPQGGIDKGEDVIVAAKRELKEEIGTDKVEVIALYPGLLRYDLPPELLGRVIKGYRGQEQQWVYARFTGTDADIDLNAHKHPEFAEWKWCDPATLPGLIVPFKQEIYIKVMAFLETLK